MPTLGDRVRTTEPLGYMWNGTARIADAGVEAVIAETDVIAASGQSTVTLVVDEPGKPHDMARIPWVVPVQFEVI